MKRRLVLYASCLSILGCLAWVALPTPNPLHCSWAVIEPDGSLDSWCAVPPSAQCHLRVCWAPGPNGKKKMLGTPTCTGLPGCNATCNLKTAPRGNGSTVYWCSCP